ncbi:hypothetical protein P2Q00_26230 [Streptomyces coacervatus]|nr:hypothetical protein [Streptomyces coacervatus]MDF2268908.1 hypothetical protein [Streptomyces coacervatus]
MSTTSRQPLRLPASAVPDGCPAWDSAGARRWTQALPPRWVPVRVPRRLVLAMGTLALIGGCALAAAGVPGFVAAFLGLQVVWLLVRPEVVRVTAAMQVVMVAGLPLAPSWLVIPCGVLVAGAFARTAQLRLQARERQREAALAATGGVTAVLPDAGRPLRRGKLFLWLGAVLFAAGAALAVAALGFDTPDDRNLDSAVGCCLAGVGLTVLLSGHLGRRRAAALRSAPAPVLRVLVREGVEADTEVFAADDLGALRPLFTVSVTDVDVEDADDEEKLDDAEIDELLDRIADDEPGPLREAVLYGAPYDGAEVLIVSVAEKPGEPVVVERSVGPVRPLSDGRVRRELLMEKYEAKRDAQYEERSRVAAEAVADDPYAVAGKGVRRWRAGWSDWLTTAGAVLWAGHFFWGETGFWRYGVGGALGAVAALLLPRVLAWRITADSEGLWFNGFRRAQHIAWDHIRVVRCKGPELNIDSHRASFDEWGVVGFRWPRLERRLGYIHPYERTAAEITAMWQEPGYRPLVRAGERDRARLLWPLGVLVALAWTAALLLLP